MATDSSDRDWQSRLRDACNSTADTAAEEQTHFRSEAEQAPLSELRIFLDRPSGKYQRDARAVMREVLRHREAQETAVQAKATWWRGLLQQASAQVLGGIFVGVLLGTGSVLLTGWACP
ncbi:hypothetical protein [Thioalkalivibrio sp. ALJ7]|uniref:hypothetical protein n=1 Tax=Thioalkalivibrio sp. ALJ7 TaxID=1158756 RepID=UPI00035F4AF7|nr:hypothetical protein [Thioalkalivibrio sp. ALJ7]